MAGIAAGQRWTADDEVKMPLYRVYSPGREEFLLAPTIGEAERLVEDRGTESYRVSRIGEEDAPRALVQRGQQRNTERKQ